MPPSTPRLRILSVGGNAVSAFLSWRLQATNACDVTLVWKSGFEVVSQYGISMRSKVFGNERFKPRHVVRTPEDASNLPGAFDYVLLCVKALPDVYDLAAVIESVVTPQHTCILLNTTNALGIESHLEERFRTNIVLSLVSGAELTQLGASEFEHHGSSEIWVGPANKNPSIPAAIQTDMAEALAMTLASGQVDCKVSDNIRQQQYERMIGPIAFHPASVLFETPNHSELIEKLGVRSMVSDIIDELLQLASRQNCTFSNGFKQGVINNMTRHTDTNSIMYQDFMARRPMEVETYLGSPLKLAQELDIRIPRIETLYALLHHLNQVNQSRPPATPGGVPMVNGVGPHPPPRLSSGPPPRPMMNGNGPRGNRPPSGPGGPPPPIRRGPPPPMMNGHPASRPPIPMPNGYPPPRGPPHPGMGVRRTSADASELEEFSHVMLYDNIPEGEILDGPNRGAPNGIGGANADLALRERELALRQRELALREQEYNMRRGRRPMAPHGVPQAAGFDDDDEEDDYFDPSPRHPQQPMIDPDNFDMMSVTSRRTRKTPSAGQLRKNPEMRSSGSYGGRPALSKNRVSARLMQDIPGLHDSLMDNPLMGFSSNRYGTVDRKVIGEESKSRTNSLTAARLEELHHQQHDGGPAGHVSAQAMGRRTSHSPGNPYGPPNRQLRRPSPPNGSSTAVDEVGMGMRQPIPQYPTGAHHGTNGAEVNGVSKLLYPPSSIKGGRSLTGSASASASASADSGSGGSGGRGEEYSTGNSSQSSLGVGVGGVQGQGAMINGGGGRQQAIIGVR